MQNDNRNFIVVIVVAMVMFAGYQFFVLGPSAEKAKAEKAREVAAQQAPAQAAPAPVVTLTRAQAIALSPRVRVDTPSLSGSINLTGARIDDLFLKKYRETVDKRSPPVELLRPEGMRNAYFTELGWAGQNLAGLPTPDTVWTKVSGDVLGPGRPIVLAHDGGGGLRFTRRIEIDDKSMFTVTDTVANLGAGSVTLAPWASVQRQGLPPKLTNSSIVHEGAIGVTDGDLRMRKYSDWKKNPDKPVDGHRGWVGITEKFWMTALAPDPSERIDPTFRVTRAGGVDIYEVNYTGQPRVIAPGRQITESTHVFAGAKTVPVLQAYEKEFGVTRFVDAVDWGFLWFLTKPIFYLVELFYGWVGNFGVAILMLTVVVRLIMFPIANRSFEMGTKMKKLQPQMQALQAKMKDDPQGLQKEMMALYAREKVNPITGCLPIFLQIPVFYSLTKLFTVTIEMRHAPFFGWITDLSAPDPTNIWNLFGLIPWDVAHTPVIGWLATIPILGGIFMMGAVPLFYGFTMWLSQAMTPMTGVDPTQQLMFKWMPIIFTLLLVTQPVGLLVYWSWSSLITILQQYVIMRRFKVDNPIDDFLARFSPKHEPAA